MQHIVLIGMSGVGKSTWARRLAADGFEHFDCDEEIAKLLQQRGLLDPRHGDPMQQMGLWLGLPERAGFAEREAIYLAREGEVLEMALRRISQPCARPLVIDTSGSAIYLGEALFDRLRRHARIIYLAVSAAQRDAMLANYLADPRPVLWQGCFQPLAGEERLASYRRCYRDLLNDRERRYTALCDLTLPMSELPPDLSAAEFLARSMPAYGGGAAAPPRD